MRSTIAALSLTALTLCGCGTESGEPPSEAVEVAIPAVSTPSSDLSPTRMAQWSRSCALCHVRGEGGAPVLGDHDAWAERLEQAENVLLAHTLEGLNNMPPLGYCMDCEEADFRALIRFMAGSP